MNTKLVREAPLDEAEVVAAVEHAAAGAVVTFRGVVRDHFHVKPITLPEYEAYPAMAEREMRAVLDEIARERPGVRVAAVHRVGALRIGDVAVVCAASAPHRAEAFEACRAVIDRVKERVPIWKREHGPDGPYWVDWRDARCSPEGHEH